MSGLPPITSGISPPPANGGITPDFVENFVLTKQDEYQCLLSAQLPIPPWADTSKNPSDAWGIALKNTTLNIDKNYRSCGTNTGRGGCTCSMLSAPPGNATCSCVVVPAVLADATFNLGDALAPTIADSKQECEDTCNASSVSGGTKQPPGCSVIAKCGSNQTSTVDIPCCPADADPSQCLCPQGGYTYENKSCSCYSAQSWWLQGECSPWGALTPLQQQAVNRIYWTMPSVVMPDGTSVSMDQLLTKRQACMQDEITAANQKQHNQQLVGGIVALVIALIFVALVIFMVRRLLRKEK
jgi:hypothetical protein